MATAVQDQGISTGSSVMGDPKRSDGGFWNAARRGKLPLETESAWFGLVSALDFFMTYILLQHPEIHFVESNPIALFFLSHWGIKGLLLFKLAVVVFVAAICQIIACHNLQLAQRVLYVGTAIVAAVVVYSVYLMQAANRGGQLPFRI